MAQIILVSLDLSRYPSGQIIRMCNAAHDVIYDGYTWTAYGDLLEFEDIEESAELVTAGTVISLSSVEINYQSQIDANQFVNAPIDILLAELPDNTNSITSASYYHRGLADAPRQVVDYSSSSMRLEVETKSILGNLKKTPDLTRCSQSTHAIKHNKNRSGATAPDQFFEFVTSASLDDEQWITS